MRQGVFLAYFLYVPHLIMDPATLLVQPNNTGAVNDDPLVHEQSARRLIESHTILGRSDGHALSDSRLPSTRYAPVGLRMPWIVMR
jgi:hypothetical protein